MALIDLKSKTNPKSFDRDDEREFLHRVQGHIKHRTDDPKIGRIAREIEKRLERKR